MFQLQQGESAAATAWSVTCAVKASSADGCSIPSGQGAVYLIRKSLHVPA